MSNDYLWDRAGAPDLDIKWLEELLAPLAHDAPLDELRMANGRQSELPRATAQEPVDVARPRGRTKGKMNLFDKRIVGAAALTAAALGLLGVSAYKSHIDANPPRPWQPPMIELAASFAVTPHAPPIAPTTGADLAITAGESAKIHVPFGAVDVEIQSGCNAEVQMSVVTYMRAQQFAHLGDPPPQALSAMLGRLEGEQPHFVVGPPSGSSGGDPIVAGIDSPDGRTSRYRLAAGIEPLGMVQYTSHCVGRAPKHGVLEIDRQDGRGAIGPITNARVFNDANDLTPEEYALAHGIHLFGSVLPGARVSIAGRSIYLEPVPPSSKDDPIVGEEFRTNIRSSLDQPTVAVRVDDVHGTQFYVVRRVMAGTGVALCTDAMNEPKQAAAKLASAGDPAGALRTIKKVIAACKPDRETLSIALEYACEAGDHDSARAYWRKLPPDLRGELEQLCALHSITRDELDAP